MTGNSPGAAPRPQITRPPASDHDIDTVARTLWGEARGEGRLGMEAVADVIRNRQWAALEYLARNPTKKRHPLFGDGTLAGVCLRPWQFSCWNAADPNLPKLKAVTKEDVHFRQALDIADIAANGILGNHTRGATHYHHRKIPKPVWTAGANHCGDVGVHIFYKNVK
ncbi:MAG TPA: cell wall hydrolase [Azospirillaceae bacterium]|nr:cell wall hydrolase [Azospirillaceae bacterium]